MFGLCCRDRWTADAVALAPPPLVQVMPGDLPDLLKEDVMGPGVSGHVAGGRVRKTTTSHPPPKVRSQLTSGLCSGPKSDSQGKLEHWTV